jgi:hypothetical protein
MHFDKHRYTVIKIDRRAVGAIGNALLEIGAARERKAIVKEAIRLQQYEEHTVTADSALEALEKAQARPGDAVYLSLDDMQILNQFRKLET